jgi:hypothetical protein
MLFKTINKPSKNALRLLIYKLVFMRQQTTTISYMRI